MLHTINKKDSNKKINTNANAENTPIYNVYNADVSNI